MTRLVLTTLFWIICFHLSAQNIFRTACQGNMERLDSMLKETTIDVKDNRGRLLIHWAVACKKKEIFDFLVEKGIDINGIDNQGKTAMHIAVRFNNEAYLDELIKLQTNTDWQSTFGGSLLEEAVLKKNKVLLEKLITNGVDVNAKNDRGSTALEISQRLNADDLSEALISLGADESLVRVFKVEGAYMGQEAPGLQSKLFAPNFISTEEQEFGCVFNTEGTAFYFGVDRGGINEIRYSKMENKQWTKPVPILSDERYSYNDPFLSNDQNRLYFISQRALDGKGEPKDVDIWFVERIKEGWSEPINVGPGINTLGDEYYISFTNDGTMYFGSNGHPRADTSRTDHDIYYSKYEDNTFQKAIALGEAVNTKQYEADVFIAPDESYLIFCSTRDQGFGRGDLYISFKNSEGRWSKAVNMGKEINTAQYEYCPFVSKDGKYLFYTSNQDIYWISTAIIEEIKQKTR